MTLRRLVISNLVLAGFFVAAACSDTESGNRDDGTENGGAAGEAGAAGAAGEAGSMNTAGENAMAGSAGDHAMAGSAGSMNQQPTAFRLHVENVAPFDHLKSGSFTTKFGGTDPGPLAPGEAYEFTFTAGPKHRLAFATMFGQSNDWFFAPVGGSLALYDGDTPISGDITDMIRLWDAGTEVDEEPAVGPHTGPNQATSTDGPGDPDPDDTVRMVPNPAILTSGATFDLPEVSDMIRVTVDSNAATREFSVRIENVSEDGVTLQTSDGGKPVRVSPGVWSVGTQPDLLFSEGEPDRGQGLEQIAEGGDVSVLSPNLDTTAGVATPLSPGLFVLSTSGEPLFTVGAPDRGKGLELLAETGNPADLAASFDAELPQGATSYGVFDTAVGASDPGPIHSGGSYDVDFEAVPGDRLSFATMYGASNDWIFAPGSEGIPLFDDNGSPMTGDMTELVSLWDVGTELSEEPAVGAHIGAPEGAQDPNMDVHMVDGSVYPVPVDMHVKVTLSTQ